MALKSGWHSEVSTAEVGVIIMQERESPDIFAATVGVGEMVLPITKVQSWVMRIKRTIISFYDPCRPLGLCCSGWKILGI